MKKVNSRWRVRINEVLEKIAYFPDTTRTAQKMTPPTILR
jgi:hypothetical protein